MKTLQQRLKELADGQPPRSTYYGICHDILANCGFDAKMELINYFDKMGLNPSFPLDDEKEYLNAETDAWGGYGGRARRMLCRAILIYMKLEEVEGQLEQMREDAGID